MTAYLIRFTKRARQQLASEMAWSRAEHGRNFQEHFLEEILQLLKLVSRRPQIHQIFPALGEGIRLFRQRGLKIAYTVDHESQQIVVLLVAGQRQELQRAIDQALNAWQREQRET